MNLLGELVGIVIRDSIMVGILGFFILWFLNPFQDSFSTDMFMAVLHSVE
jgi:hypothetical protein